MTYTHRLFCESCTGIAAYSDAQGVKGSGEVVCPNCGKVTPVKRENWIQLTQSEAKRINVVKESLEQKKK